MSNRVVGYYAEIVCFPSCALRAVYFPSRSNNGRIKPAKTGCQPSGQNKHDALAHHKRKVLSTNNGWWRPPRNNTHFLSPSEKFQPILLILEGCPQSMRIFVHNQEKISSQVKELCGCLLQGFAGEQEACGDSRLAKDGHKKAAEN